MIIPTHAKEAFIRYFDEGLAPGGFCSAVLANDLLAASARADYWNKQSLGDIMLWVIEHGPKGSYGSYEHVQGWLDKNEFFQAYQKQRLVDILKEEDPWAK